MSIKHIKNGTSSCSTHIYSFLMFGPWIEWKKVPVNFQFLNGSCNLDMGLCDCFPSHILIQQIKTVAHVSTLEYYISSMCIYASAFTQTKSKWMTQLKTECTEYNNLENSRDCRCSPQRLKLLLLHFHCSAWNCIHSSPLLQHSVL